MFGFGDITIDINADVTGAIASLTALKTQMTGLTTSVATFGTTAEGALRKFGNSAVGAGGIATAMFTAPLILGLKEVVDAGMDFDQWLSKTASLYPTADITELKEELKELAFEFGSTTKFSATEAMEAMYAVGQAGYDVADMYEYVNAGIVLATAQNYDLDDSLRMVISAMNAFKGEGYTAADVANIYAAAMTASLGEMSDLADGIKYILPVFSALGYSMEDGIALMTLLIDIGYKGQNAGRILRDAFTDMINPTAEAKAILEKYNIQLYSNSAEFENAAAKLSNAQDKLNTMNDTYEAMVELGQLTDEQDVQMTKDIEAQEAVVDELSKAYKDLTAEGLKPMEEVLIALGQGGMTLGEATVLFGKTSASGMMHLTQSLTEEDIAARLDEITASSEAFRQAAVQMESPSMKITLALQALSTIKTEIFYDIADSLAKMAEIVIENKDTIKEFFSEFAQGMVVTLEKLVDMIVKVMDWWSSLGEGTKDRLMGMITTIASILAVVGPVILVLGALAWSLASIITIGKGVGGTLAFVGGRLGKLLGLGGGAATATGQTTLAMFGLETGATSAGLGLAGIVQLITKLIPILAVITTAITIFWYSWTNNSYGTRDVILGALDALKGIIEYVQTGIGWLTEWFGEFWTALTTGDVEGAKEKIRELFSTIWDVLVDIISSEKTEGLVDWLVDVFTEVIPEVVTTLKTMRDTFYQSVWELIVDLLQYCIDHAEELDTAIKTLIAAIGGLIWDSFWEWLSEMFYSQLEKDGSNLLVDAFTTIFEKLDVFFIGGAGAKFAFEWGKNLIGEFIEGITGVDIEPTMKAVAEEVEKYLGVHSDTKVGPMSDLTTWGGNLVDTFSQGMMSSLSNLNFAVGDVASNISCGLKPMNISGQPSLSALGGRAATYNTIYVTNEINNPVIRNDGDITKLSKSISDTLNERWSE